MFDIKLFKNFTKKLNSTRTPNETFVVPDTYQCTLLDAQSVMNPVIIIEDTKGIDEHMMYYTYASIPNLERYYFITNTVAIDNTRWAFYLQVDVLGSFKSDFLTSRQYVLRATNQYNDYITDTMYPTVPMPQNQRFAMNIKVGNTIQAFNEKTATWSAVDFFNQTYLSGSVIFGVTGQGGVSVDYYVATVTEFKNFINRVVTANPTGLDWGNLPQGVQTTLSNLMQYITFAKWIPFMPLVGNLGSAITSVNLGTTSISVTGYKVTAGLSKQHCKFTLGIPNHPLYSTHKYYNLLPYREVNLFFLPLGVIPIDPTKIWDVEYLYVHFTTDLASGNTEFTILTDDDDTNSLDHILMSSVTNIGIDLSLTDYSMSIEAALFSAVGSYISNAFNQMKAMQPSAGGSATHTSSAGVTHGGHGGYTNARTHISSSGATHGGRGGSLGEPSGRGILEAYLTGSQYADDMLKAHIEEVAKRNYDVLGNALQPLADMLGTAADFVASSFGQVSMNGHTGSFLMYMATMPAVYCWFYKHGTEDYDRFGRPFYNTVRLSNVSGFCMCKNSYVDYILTHPLKPEVEGIANLLNSGIYIEEVDDKE